MTVLIASFTFGVVLQLSRIHFAGTNSSRAGFVTKWDTTRSLIHPLVVAYLLTHIGLLGGAEVAKEGLARFAVPGTLSLILGMGMFAIAWGVVSALRIADRETRISLATHFGSVSVGTFATAQAFLTTQGIPFDSSSAAWLTLMEVPSILIGAMLVGNGIASLKQTLRDREILILLGSLIVGLLVGPQTLNRLHFVIVNPFDTVLAYFLFDMGQHAGEQVAQLRAHGGKLIAYGLLMPLLGAVLGGFLAALAGMTLGDMIMLSTLSASASYVAATAVLSKIVSPKAIATSLAVSIGVTLPWNVLLGIPLYTQMAQRLQAFHFEWKELPTVQLNSEWAFSLAILSLLVLVGIVLLRWKRYFLIFSGALLLIALRSSNLGRRARTAVSKARTVRNDLWRRIKRLVSIASALCDVRLPWGRDDPPLRFSAF